jgi:hypothetical protein
MGGFLEISISDGMFGGGFRIEWSKAVILVPELLSESIQAGSGFADDFYIKIVLFAFFSLRF